MRARDQHSSFPVSIERFLAGYVTNRSPLHTPFKVVGLNVVPLNDALIDGLNVELSPRNTLVRRPGYPRFCSVAVTGTPLGFGQFKRVGNSPYLILDTTGAVYQFTSSAITSLFSKGTTSQTYFQQAGTTLYCANGTDLKKIDANLNVTNWGITAPAAAPNVANVAASALPTWAANTFYSTSLLLIDSNNNIQLLTTAGTTGGSQPTWATVAGNTTTDGSAVWTCQGTATRATSHAYSLGALIAVTYTHTYTYTYTDRFGVQHTGTVNVTYNDTFQVTTAGTSSSIATGSLSWAPGVGAKTTDGTVVWTNQGTQITWSTIGATTLVSTNTYIVDSSGNQQLVNGTGKSGSSAPSFSSVIGQNTTDNGTAWTCNGPLAAANTLPWTYVFVFKNSTTGHISSASPTSAQIFLASSSYISVSGNGSSDSQVDKIDIYRTSQGGSVFYYVATVSNPGGSSTWSYTDTTNDSQLNTQLIVTTIPLNNPPPSGTALVAFYQGRIWVASGNNLYFDGGGDIINGVAHECFPPANVFPFLSNITALVPTSQGLVVFLDDQIHAILGGPQTLTYYPQQIFDGMGVSSQNAVTQDGDTVYFVSTQGQGQMLSPSDQGEFGFGIADVLQSKFLPASSYLARHRSGSDFGIFISDGSTNLIRFNQTNQHWNPPGQPVGGCGPIASLETSAGVYSLLTTIGGYICARNTTNFVDGNAASAYSPFATIGSIEVAQMAAETANVKNVALRVTKAGSKPTVGIALNRTDGTFSNVPFNSTIPARLDGTYNPTVDIRQLQYDLSVANPAVAWDQFNHVQLKVSWPAENAQNELVTVGIYGTK